MRRPDHAEIPSRGVGAIPDLQAIGSIKLPSRGTATTEAAPSGVPKPSPISDTVIFVAPPDREARLESRAPVIANPQPNKFAKVQGVDNVIVRLQTSLDRVEGRQLAALSSVEDGMESRVRRMRGVFTDLGLDMTQMEAATPRTGMGGPYVPVKLTADAGPFERQLYQINITRAQMERLNRTLALVPYRKPVIGEVEFTSGFGIAPTLPRPPGHAYRSGFPRGDGRPRARHRERQSGVSRMGRWIWPHGGNRPW